MPASLTNQVRLGFSMGWRIWTPNEVGFYAKTLAHSYFILVILKSKFLQEKIWIVNYNLFMGTKRYLVFIEFLKFGMKSKEERSFWRKIMYISIIARHSKFTQKYMRMEEAVYNASSIRKNILANLPPIAGSKKWYRLNQKSLNKIIPKFKNFFKSKFIHFSYNFVTGMSKKKKLLSNESQYIEYCDILFQKSNLKKKTNLITFFNANRIFGLHKLNNSIIKRRLKLGLKNKIKKTKELIIKKKIIKKNEYNESLDFKKLIFSNKNLKNINESVRLLKTPIKSNLKFYKYIKESPLLLKKYKIKKNKNEYLNVKNIKLRFTSQGLLAFLLTKDPIYSKTFFNSKKDKEVYKTYEMHFKPLPEIIRYSFCGGPRKRMSRVLKRAFKGKYIKTVTNLLWFWEKLARMLSFYLFRTVKKINIGIV